jgi:predicted nucleotidyltransferase component of viral defense system
MLTTGQLRQVAVRTAARDIMMVETDILLTHLLQLFHETGLVEHLAFKGGTMFRKMVFGPSGRFSTDLDFTCRSEVSRDDLTLMLLEALSASYHGIAFRFDRDKDWYLTEDGCAANPTCSHPANERGVKIKVQVSTRERPLLPIGPVAQLQQDYFRLLPFQPAPIPCLALEEAIAEKIRAASQRSKIRDLYDLAEFASRPLNRHRIRSLAVLKLWSSGGPGLDYEHFKQRIEERSDYDVDELRNLLRREHRPDLDKMISQVVEGFRFLKEMTELERAISADHSQRRPADAALLIAHVTHPHLSHRGPTLRM